MHQNCCCSQIQIGKHRSDTERLSCATRKQVRIIKQAAATQA